MLYTELVVNIHMKDFTEGQGERGGSVVECRTPEREVRGSRPTVAVLCPWARHFTPRKYWLITQEAMAPSRYDWKIVDWDVKPQHNQPTTEGQTLAGYKAAVRCFLKPPMEEADLVVEQPGGGSSKGETKVL